MKHLFAISILVLTFIFTFTISIANADNPRVVNKIIASVDGEALTLNDLQAYLSAIGRGETDISALSKSDLSDAIHDLVSMRLIEKESKTLGLEVSNAEIDAYVKEVMTMNKVNEKQFANILKDRGLNLPSYKEQIKRDIYKNKIMSAIVRNSVTVSDADIDRHLEANPNEIPKAEQIHVEQLYYKFLPEMNEKEKNDALSRLSSFAENLKAKISNIKAQQAQNNSSNNANNANISLAQFEPNNYVDLGYISPDDTKEELQSALKELNVGEISAPIKTKDGIYILYILTKFTDVAEDKEFRSAIRNKIFETRYKEKIEKYFSEELPKKYFISINQ